MQTTVSNRNFNPAVDYGRPYQTPYWLVWLCVSESKGFWVPNTDKQYKTKADAITAAKAQGDFVDMGR